MTRPFDQLTRLRPPTLTSRIMRTNVRYSRERELGVAPWKAMKTSCAASSCRVIFRIQRRTVGEALIEGTDVFFEALLTGALADALDERAGGLAGIAPATASTTAAATR